MSFSGLCCHAGLFRRSPGNIEARSPASSWETAEVRVGADSTRSAFSHVDKCASRRICKAGMAAMASRAGYADPARKAVDDIFRRILPGILRAARTALFKRLRRYIAGVFLGRYR